MLPSIVSVPAGSTVIIPLPEFLIIYSVPAIDAAVGSVAVHVPEVAITI